MRRKILLIYQDCTDCGAIKDWAERQRILAEKYHFKIEKMQFTSAELEKSELHKKAFASGKVKSYPFFTDGKKFSKTLEDFVEKVADEGKADAEAVTGGDETSAEAMVEKPAKRRIRRKKQTEAAE